MQVHPDLARLRSDGARQSRCDAALAAWRASPDMLAVLAALARYDAGERLDDLPALTRITSDHAAGRALVADFIGPLTAALRAEPLAQLALGHSAAPGMARLRLASHGRAGLTLVAFARREPAASPSVLFEDCAVHEVVVAGTARGLQHRLDHGRLITQELTFEPGVRITRDGPHTARQITTVTRPLLLLQLTCEAAQPAPSCEIALDDGRLLKAISGCKATSQQMMALGVLGALAHRPALDEMARLARDETAQRDLRWEALRQSLALDAVRGLALLTALAGDDGDILSAPAAALGRQLRASRPDLAALLMELA